MMELELNNVVDIEFTSVEEGASGIHREIIIRSKDGDIKIKLYAESDPSDIKVLI
jgi:hypothetical protein